MKPKMKKAKKPSTKKSTDQVFEELLAWMHEGLRYAYIAQSRRKAGVSLLPAEETILSVAPQMEKIARLLEEHGLIKLLRELTPSRVPDTEIETLAVEMINAVYEKAKEDHRRATRRTWRSHSMGRA